MASAGGERQKCVCNVVFIVNRHHTKNTSNWSPVWSVTPCVCLRKDNVHRQASSDQHAVATELEKTRVVAADNEARGLSQAFKDL